MVKRLTAVYPWLICSFWAFITTSVSTTLASQPDTSYEETLEMLTYITGSLSTLALFAIGVYKRSALNAMLSLMRREFWHDDRRPAAHALFSRFVRTYGTVMPVANVLMCIAPVVWAVSRGNIESPAALIFRMWTPWTRLTPARYAAVYATQFTVSVTVLTSISGMVFAMVLVVNEMQVQMDILVDAVRELRVNNFRGGGDGDQVHRTSTARTITDDLVRCVKHHQMLIT